MKKIFIVTSDGERDRGQPRLRWLDSVGKDLKDLGVRIWRKRAEDRTEWLIILKETIAKL